MVFEAFEFEDGRSIHDQVIHDMLGPQLVIHFIGQAMLCSWNGLKQSERSVDALHNEIRNHVHRCVQRLEQEISAILQDPNRAPIQEKHAYSSSSGAVAEHFMCQAILFSARMLRPGSTNAEGVQEHVLHLVDRAMDNLRQDIEELR